jgi:drug/metabolite transporter superfamily protein YnfA
MISKRFSSIIYNNIYNFFSNLEGLATMLLTYQHTIIWGLIYKKQGGYFIAMFLLFDIINVVKSMLGRDHQI